MNKIVFFGNERLSRCQYNQAPILEYIAQNYNIEALVIKDNVRLSRQQASWASLDIAKRYNIPVVKINRNSDLKSLPLYQAKLAILASFGLIVPNHILQRFPLGIINIHPSLLPKYRGSTPIESALANGEQTTGISLMRLTKDLDAGGIYAQQELLVGQDSKLELTQRLASLAVEMLSKNLPLIYDKQLQARPQDASQASYTEPLVANLITNLQEKTAQSWLNYIRAYQDCPNNRFVINHKTVAIIEATLVKNKQSGSAWYDRQTRLLCLQCHNNSHLGIKSLKPQNTRQMTAEAFVNGFWQNLERI